MKELRDKHGHNEYCYIINTDFVSGGSTEISLSKGSGKNVPFPYVLRIGNNIAALDFQGMKELIEAAVKVL